MKVMRCEKGHFYDGDKYDCCPYCNGRSEKVELDPKFDPEIIICEYPIEDYPKKIHEDSVFLRCKNGHTYNRELYDRCPVCKKAELERREKQEAGKEQSPIKLTRCELGHFYDGARYDCCPYCGGEALKENRLPDEKQQNGQEENLPDKGKNFGEKERLIATITYCKRGHYYDGELYDTCPYCGKQEDESSCDGSFEFFGRPDNRGMYHGELWSVTPDGEYNRVYFESAAPIPPRPTLEVKKCRNGHYFDGNREKVCPYCGEAAAETIETI